MSDKKPSSGEIRTALNSQQPIQRSQQPASGAGASQQPLSGSGGNHGKPPLPKN